jgi:signal peptidase II
MSADSGPRRVPASRYWLFLGVAAFGCGIDLATKSWIFAWIGMPDDPRRGDVWLWRDVFSLTTSLNPGALFGLGQGFHAAFAALSVAAAILILYWLFYVGAARDRVLTFTLALIMAGIAGNLYDRLGLPDLRFQGHEERVYAVRDWLHFKINGLVDWPVFNVADSMLVCGAIILFWHVWSSQRSTADGQQSVDEPAKQIPSAAGND